MNAPETLRFPSMRERVSAEEWQVRQDLAACYRLVADFGWSDLVFTHITARVPGTEDQFLINPYGLMFDEITASSLVRIDQQGNKLDDNPYPVNPAGFTIHSAVHAVRHDALCVMHTHTANGVAVSAQKEGLLPLSQQSIFVLSSLGYHGYEGVALNDEEKPRLVQDLGRNTYLMLRNHGLLTVGGSVADAFIEMYTFEAACMIQIRAQAGGELITVDPKIIAGATAMRKAVSQGVGPGALAWPSLLRKLDRIDPSFRSLARQHRSPAWQSMIWRRSTTSCASAGSTARMRICTSAPRAASARC
jgi:ribulose-5-phosphate 4-epimerase/fuculose-1-phosphate aldolase